MKKQTILALILIFSVSGARNVSAGSAGLPKQSFGIGTTVGLLNGRTSAVGAHGVFALTSTFHIGAQLGFAFQSADGGPSRNYFQFAPYAKVLLTGGRTFTPFFLGQLIIDNGGSEYEFDGGDEFGLSSSMRTSLFIGGGAQFFPTSTVGVFGYVGLIDIGLDPEATRIGLLEPRVGIEWFFGSNGSRPQKATRM